MQVSRFHAVGVMSSLASLLAGGSVVYPSGSFIGETAVIVFESEHCTHKGTVPNMVSALISRMMQNKKKL